MTERHFDALPSMLKGYKQALTQRPSSAPAPDVLKVCTRGVSINRINLKQFNTLCGSPTRTTLPITYLHILAAPLHIQLLTHPQCPFKAMGCVHVRNVIEVYRHVHALNLFDIEVSLGEQRQANKGIEFDIHTRISVDDEVIWTEVTTVLAPGKSSGSSKGHKKTPPTPYLQTDLDRSTTWRLPANLGLKYAKVCGDFNPIHLFPITAKLFGFQRQIIHGMWTVSRLTAELDNDLPELPIRQTVAFKRPIALPQTVHVGSWPQAQTRRAQVFSKDRSTIFVDVTLEHISS